MIGLFSIVSTNKLNTTQDFGRDHTSICKQF